MHCLEYWNKSLMYIGKSRGSRILPKITNFGGDVMLFLIDVKLYVKIRCKSILFKSTGAENLMFYHFATM